VTARGKALLWAGVALACLVLVFVKVRLESGEELTLARAARDRGERDRAGLHYRRAIRWYTPFSSSVEAAVDELKRLAQEQEGGAGAPADALALYRDLRGALYAIRHLSEPYREVRDEVEERIAHLMAHQPPTTVEDRKRTTEERRVFFLAQLRSVQAPDIGWTVALLVGFFGWVASAAVFFWRGFTREGKLLPRPALLWGSLIVACFALWVVGMTQA
jgi:hypothetical protein